MAYLPGNEGGIAIADVLFGDVNPSGKLPFTYPREPHSLVTYDHKGTDKVHSDFSNNAFNPLYEFGHGLSYTQFKYSNLKLNSNTINKGGELLVSIDVENTSKRDGKEVVQLFTTDHVASITPSTKRLRKFEKIELKAQEKKTVSFKIGLEDLAFIGLDHLWTTEPGKFSIEIGGLADEFEYAGEVQYFDDL